MAIYTLERIFQGPGERIEARALIPSSAVSLRAVLLNSPVPGFFASGGRSLYTTRNFPARERGEIARTVANAPRGERSSLSKAAENVHHHAERILLQSMFDEVLAGGMGGVADSPLIPHQLAPCESFPPGEIILGWPRHRIFMRG